MYAWGIWDNPLQEHFVEFLPYASGCKFSDCRHLEACAVRTLISFVWLLAIRILDCQEPACQVKEAVEELLLGFAEPKLFVSVYICLFMHFLCAGGLHTSRAVYVVQAHSPVAFGRPVNFRLSYRWISSQFWAYHPSKLCRGRFRRRSDD